MSKPESARLRVFLCHSSGDKAVVRKLYYQLKEEGFRPWLDEEDLVPGQNWQTEIRREVRRCHVVVICLSRESMTKVGYVQKEIKYALDAADEQPDGTIFLIPLKLEECDIPERLSHLQWVDYFKKPGHDQLVRALSERARSLGIEVVKLETNSVAFTVGVVALASNRQLECLLSKQSLIDGSPRWTIGLYLKERVGNKKTVLVQAHVRVKDLIAERLMKQRLSDEQYELLRGPIASRIQDLPTGTTADQTLEGLLKLLLKTP